MERLKNSYKYPNKIIDQQYSKLKKSPKKKFQLPNKKEPNYNPLIIPKTHIKPLIKYKKPNPKKKSLSKDKSINFKSTIIKGLASIYKSLINSNDVKKTTNLNTKPFAPPIVMQPYKKNKIIDVPKIKKQSPPLKGNKDYKFGKASKYAKRYEYQEPVFSQRILESFPNTNKKVLMQMFPNTPVVNKTGKKVVINEKFNPNFVNKLKGKNIVSNYQKKFNKLYSITENEKIISPSKNIQKKEKNINLPPMIMEEDLGLIRKYANKVKKPKTEKPKTEKPKTEKSKTEKSKTEKSKTEKPKTEKSKTEKPKTEKPKTEKPKTEKPKTEKRKTEKRKTVSKSPEKPNNKICPKGKILNIKTNRCVKIDSNIGKNIMKKL